MMMVREQIENLVSACQRVVQWGTAPTVKGDFPQHYADRLRAALNDVTIAKYRKLDADEYRKLDADEYISRYFVPGKENLWIFIDDGIRLFTGPGGHRAGDYGYPIYRKLSENRKGAESE